MAKKPERERVCSFCGEHSPNKLIAGPTVFICDECVARAAELARAGNTVVQPSIGSLNVVPESDRVGVFRFFWKRLRHPEPACSFCGRSPPDLVQPPSALGTHALICGECIGLCQDIIAERLEHSHQRE